MIRPMFQSERTRMRLPLISLCFLGLAACAPERQVTQTTIVASVTPEQQTACRAAAANARNLDVETVTISEATVTTTGPILALDVNGASATCKLNMLGEVEDVTFG